MKRAFLISLAGLALASLLGCQPADRAPAGTFNGIDITGAEYARQLNLTDADGQRRTLDDFKGKVLVVFFGYTQCPDVCPTTLSELAAARQALGADGERVQGIFVSVDPARDTPEVLGAYVKSFGPGITALYGNADETKAAAKEFKVFYTKVPGKTDASYTVDHTAGSYLFDAKGRVRVMSRYGAGVPALTQDLKRLLAEG